jgi:taurine--2-oxoglutarate transaminase
LLEFKKEDKRKNDPEQSATSLSSADTSKLVREYTYGTWRYQKGWNPLNIVDAEGCYFVDSSGKKYLDFSSQLMCTNLGHKNKAVIEAIREQAQKLPYISPSFACDVRAEISNLLLEVLPQGLEKFFFSTSGTEANEAAIKIARMYTGKYKIISRYYSYHGSTAGSISLTGDYRRFYVEPAGKIQGGIFAPDAYCYRCPLDLKYPDCAVECGKYVEYMIKHEGNVAAVIVEPVVGSNGILVPPDEYLPIVREITERHNVLLIADEVMSGWGRTGEWFAVDNWDVKPDILTTAKGLTGSYIPLGLTATTREIAEYFEDNYFAHGHTYEAHPLALAAGVAAIKEYKRLDLIQRSKKMGEYLGRRLRELKDKHQSIGDVRGVGLFWATELVSNRENKKPLQTLEDKLSRKPLTVDRITSELTKQGVYVFSGISHLILAPPLIVEKEDIDKGVEALDNALKIADDEVFVK